MATKTRGDLPEKPQPLRSIKKIPKVPQKKEEDQLGEEIQSYISKAGIQALRRLEEFSRSEDEKIAFAATQEILNRAFGKAVALIPRSERNGEATPVIEIINYADWLEQQMENGNA